MLNDRVDVAGLLTPSPEIAGKCGEMIPHSPFIGSLQGEISLLRFEVDMLVLSWIRVAESTTPASPEMFSALITLTCVSHWPISPLSTKCWFLTTEILSSV